MDFLDTVQDKQFPQWNAANEEFIPAFLPVYGTQYNFAQQASPTATSSTQFQTHQTLVTPTVPAGSYQINWEFTWNIQNSGSPEMEVLVEANATNLSVNNFLTPNDNNGSADNRFKNSSMNQFVLATAGIITVTIKLRRQGTSRICTMFDSRITLIRVI